MSALLSPQASSPSALSPSSLLERHRGTACPVRLSDLSFKHLLSFLQVRSLGPPHSQSSWHYCYTTLPPLPSPPLPSLPQLQSQPNTVLLSLIQSHIIIEGTVTPDIPTHYPPSCQPPSPPPPPPLPSPLSSPPPSPPPLLPLPSPSPRAVYGTLQSVQGDGPVEAKKTAQVR